MNYWALRAREWQRFDSNGRLKSDGKSSGSPALTTRGFLEEDFEKAAEFFDCGVRIASKVKEATEGEKTPVCYVSYELIWHKLFLLCALGSRWHHDSLHVQVPISRISMTQLKLPQISNMLFKICAMKSKPTPSSFQPLASIPHPWSIQTDLPLAINPNPQNTISTLLLKGPWPNTCWSMWILCIFQ